MPESLSQMVRDSESAPVEDSSAVQPVDAAPVEQTQSPATEGEGGTEAAAVGTFRRFLTESKFEVPEEIDESTLQSQVAQRLHAAAKFEEDNRRLQQEIEQYKASQSHTQPPTPAATIPTPLETPVPAATATPERNIWSESYQVNPADMSLVVRNDKGIFEPRDDSDQAAQAADSMNRSLSVTQQRLHQFASNPQSFLDYAEKKLFEKWEKEHPRQVVDPEEITKRAVEMVREQQETANREATIDSWYETNKANLFKVDQSGNYVHDPMSGAVIKTDVGVRFQNAMNTLRELGVDDELKLINTAWEWVSPLSQQQAPAAQQQAPVQPPAPTQETQHQRFLDREEPLPEVPSVNRMPGRPEASKRPLSLLEMVSQDQAAL